MAEERPFLNGSAIAARSCADTGAVSAARSSSADAMRTSSFEAARVPIVMR